MQPRTSLFRARRSAVMSLLALPLLLTGCASAGSPTAEPSPQAAAMSHVHGISVDPESSRILLATHDGLYDATRDPAVKISDTTIDLMGFTDTAEPNVFYASGHPGPGSSLPNPVGLIRSDDAGKTWESVSRAGESDFHTLTVSGNSLVAFDGQLRTSTDGVTWTMAATTFTPAVLAGSPASTMVLATTEHGVQRSIDSGTTWQAVPKSPVIQYATMVRSETKAPTEAVGIAPDGSVFISPDTGLTWNTAGRIAGQVEAVTANESDTGELTIWAATTTGVQASTDGGMTFHPATT